LHLNIPTILHPVFTVRRKIFERGASPIMP
jgi:hypothetical protein